METQKLLFLDIETVSGSPDYEELSERWKELWASKSRFFAQQQPELSPARLYAERSAIFAEFGRIVCISIGFFNGQTFRVKSFTGEESDLLREFFSLVARHFHDPKQHGFCGHNIREFDLPYLCRRAVIHQIEIPPILQLSGRKPWETPYILDTLELWKFGDVKNFSSLDLLAACLGLPTSKSDISGKDVGRVFWEENDVSRIATYCEKDVVLTARVYLRLSGKGGLEDDQVEFVN
jgi:predicted PolB exonuclease-like 3'-5' exonuclease